MNRNDYFAFHDDFCRRMQETTKKKNQDYAGGGDDPFANFRVVEKIGAATVEQGFLTRMSDKFIRMVNLSDGRDPAVVDESLEDTILDLANYCALFAGYLRSKRQDFERFDKKIDELIAEHGALLDLVEKNNKAFAEQKIVVQTGPVVERYYEIIATSRSGDIVIETCPNAIMAATRLDELRAEWPTFKLRIEECEAMVGDDDEHSDVA